MNTISCLTGARTGLFSGRNHQSPTDRDAVLAGRDRGGLAHSLLGWVVVALLGLMLGGTGCKTGDVTPLTADETQPYMSVGVQPGDMVRINFPAAPTMNSVQQVQSDGTIALPLGGTITVKGKSPAEIEKEVLKAYDAQLVVKEVSVSVESGGFAVYVSGAVLRPGKVQCRQSMTVLEAVVEAGGFAEGRADLKNVKVVRQQPDKTTRTFILNLQKSLRGEAAEPFFLRPSDVVYVPERFAFY
ncbi:MAG: polysaccharide biosynthesis/export family protein [Verrucomicrobiales bacterium]|nr:polysaccharide biosynthesis/export family protein [Verrucomicrobiales bacterium]